VGRRGGGDWGREEAADWRVIWDIFLRDRSPLPPGHRSPHIRPTMSTPAYFYSSQRQTRRGHRSIGRAHELAPATRPTAKWMNGIDVSWLAG
jgi:hypothetical protein